MRERFFYKTEYPHEYQNGWSSHLNDDYIEIASLEEARELAIKHWKGTFGVGGHHKTSYGVEYQFEKEDLVNGTPVLDKT